jgi:hypothetical protein
MVVIFNDAMVMMVAVIIEAVVIMVVVMMTVVMVVRHVDVDSCGDGKQ